MDSNGQSLARYYYDPFGRRIAKTVDGTTTWYFYSEEGLVAEMDANGTLITQYGWWPDGVWGTNPLYIRQNGHIGYYRTTT